MRKIVCLNPHMIFLTKITNLYYERWVFGFLGTSDLWKQGALVEFFWNYDFGILLVFTPFNTKKKDSE